MTLNFKPLSFSIRFAWQAIALLVLSLLFFGVTPLKADTADRAVMQPINEMVAAINRGDIKSVASQFSDDTVIVDEFAPFVWRGSDAATRWMGDFGALLKQMSVTEVKVSLGAARYPQVSSDDAYVVMPTTVNMTEKGKLVKETADWTFALSRKNGAWKITALTWAHETG